jgi:plastocyanin
MGPAALAAALGLALVACGSSEQPARQNANTVVVKTFQFLPASVSIEAEESVSWTNGDDIKHTVTSGVPGRASGLFAMPLDGKGASARFTFAGAAVVPYFCSIHQGMRGEVRVS